MKKHTKALCISLSLMLGCASLASCGGGTSNSGATNILIMNTDGGVGQAWLDNALARFQEKVAEKSYEDGKKGITYKVTSSTDTGVNTMASAAYNIYFDEGTATIKSLTQKGFLADIDDIVKETLSDYGESGSIEDKIDAEYKATCQGADGKYYALPHFALHPGLTYDVELFTNENMFLAAPDADAADKISYTAECGVGSATFLNTSDNPNAKKSCGNDGKYGTADDGLPTSMVEFFILCDRLADSNIEPIAVRGNSTSYTTYLYNALWGSLSGGYEAASAKYTLNGEDIEVVTATGEDYTSEPLWAGLGDYAKKPNTEVIDIARTNNGYRANDSVARYYAISALKIIEEMGWFSQLSYSNSGTHTTVMEKFIFGGRMSNPKQAMLIEGDYWYNEAVDNDKINMYKQLFPNEGDRQLAWMPLPTHAYDSVTGEDNAREFVMVNTTASYAFINGNIKNAGVLEACKDFLQFCYTDAELSQFTGLTGVAKAAIDYDILPEHTSMLSYYHKSVVNVRSDANTRIVNAMKDSLWVETISPMLAGKGYISHVQAMRDVDASVEELFESTRTSSAGWGNL